MGQCGCGDINPILVLKIGEYYLVVDEYWGCSDCNNPIGISLHLYSGEQFKNEWGKTLSDLTEKFFPEKYGCNSKHFNFVGRDELMKAAEELEDDKEHVSPVSEYDSLKDFVDDNGLHLLQEAMKKRIGAQNEDGKI